MVIVIMLLTTVIHTYSAVSQINIEAWSKTNAGNKRIGIDYLKPVCLHAPMPTARSHYCCTAQDSLNGDQLNTNFVVHLEKHD